MVKSRIKIQVFGVACGHGEGAVVFGITEFFLHDTVIAAGSGG